MKKMTTLLLALVMTLSIGFTAFAAMPETAGAPEFEVSALITPDSLTVYQGEAINLTAVTTFTSNKGDNQWLHFVSDEWTGADVNVPVTETEPAAKHNERQQEFIATASVFVSDEPGQHEVNVTYTITLQHDNSGKRTYKTVANSATLTVEVLAGSSEAELADTAIPEGGMLSHGKIVSAWAHWKQAKGNETFLAGGPEVEKSLVWYKTQVENGYFTSAQQVNDNLDSIYEPENRHMKKEKGQEKVKEQDSNGGKGGNGKGN